MTDPIVRKPFTYYDMDGKPVPLQELGDLFSGIERIMKQDEVENFLVSTVWIGVDMNYEQHGPPLIFETMVFDTSGGDEYFKSVFQDRYATKEEALAGHEAAMKLYPWEDAVDG